MAKPQQPELHRSGHSPADPGAAKSAAGGTPPAVSGTGADRVPEANQPGHPPDHEQDKPLERFEARARGRRTAGAVGGAGSPGEGRRRADPFAPAGGEGDGGAPPPPPWPGLGSCTLGGVPVGVLVPAAALADAALRPGWEWEEAGESRLRWMARIALLPVIGPWRYDRLRHRLDSAGRSTVGFRSGVSRYLGGRPGATAAPDARTGPLPANGRRPRRSVSALPALR